MADEPKPKNSKALTRPSEPPTSEVFSPRLLEQFFENQRRELEVRVTEIKLEQERNQQQHEVAKTSIDAQLRDRDSERKHRGGETTKGTILAAVIILVIATVIV